VISVRIDGISFHQNGALVTIVWKVACPQDATPTRLCDHQVQPTILPQSRKKQVFDFSMRTTTMCDPIAHSVD